MHFDDIPTSLSTSLPLFFLSILLLIACLFLFDSFPSLFQVTDNIIMRDCVPRLLQLSGDEVVLESLCQLLTTAGGVMVVIMERLCVHLQLAAFPSPPPCSLFPFPSLLLPLLPFSSFLLLMLPSDTLILLINLLHPHSPCDHGY